VTLKSLLKSLKVIANDTIRKLGYGFIFAFHSNYMALTCIISEIKPDIRRKSRFFHIPLHSTPPLVGFQSEYCHIVWYEKTRLVG